MRQDALVLHQREVGANIKGVLFDQAAVRFDQAIQLCRAAGFRRISLRGDTDFSSTQHLDRWDKAGVRFVFGIDAMAKLVTLAASLAGSAWERLQRPAKYAVKTAVRDRRENIKERVVREREFQNIRLRSEDVAEFGYQPGACRRPYRVVVVRKNLSVEKGEQVLFDDLRYFFYITNDKATPAAELVLLANDRCNQENLIEQLKNGVHALRMPVGTLVSNGAYMVMASLAWTLKAWFALLLPETGRWGKQYAAEKRTVLRMEFRTFQRAFIAMPCQIIRAGRRIVFRLLAWNPWQRVFLRGVEALRLPLRCLAGRAWAGWGGNQRPLRKPATKGKASRGQSQPETQSTTTIGRTGDLCLRNRGS